MTKRQEYQKDCTPEENARRAKICELLQVTDGSSKDDIQRLFKETIAVFTENGSEAELEDELGYSRYDYKNMDTDNTRNDHSCKTLRTSFGSVDVLVSLDRKGSLRQFLIKPNNLLTRSLDRICRITMIPYCGICHTFSSVQKLLTVNPIFQNSPVQAQSLFAIF